jgi:sugar O-acyltransferase (sialic acid O-acetyltransferase NeuD family)
VDCILYGVGSPFVENVIEALHRLDWTIVGGVENVESDYRPAGLSPIISAEAIPAEWLRLPAVLPLVTPGHRWTLERDAVAHGFATFASVIDPTAHVASTARIGDGTVVVTAVSIGAGVTIGRSVCLNSGTIVGHHATLGDYAATGPGAILCGYVSVGRGAFIGAGAIVNPRVSIGANALIASGAVVRRDVPEHTLMAGNPAVAVTKTEGYNDVSVPGA